MKLPHAWSDQKMVTAPHSRDVESSAVQLYSLSACLSSDAVLSGQDIHFEVRPLLDNMPDQSSADPPTALRLGIANQGAPPRIRQALLRAVLGQLHSSYPSLSLPRLAPYFVAVLSSRRVRPPTHPRYVHTTCPTTWFVTGAGAKPQSLTQVGCTPPIREHGVPTASAPRASSSRHLPDIFDQMRADRRPRTIPKPLPRAA